MSTEKQGFTEGPWTLELIDTFPFGVRITDESGHEVLSQYSRCHSSDQKTRVDNESGLGFRHFKKTPATTTQEEAAAAIAKQDARARLIAHALEMYRLLANQVCRLCELKIGWHGHRGDDSNCGGCAEARAVISAVEGKCAI